MAAIIKNQALVTLPLIVLTLVLCSSCSTHKQKTDPAQATTGWVDDHTFIMNAIGKPVRKYTGLKERQDSARRAAVINVHFKILKKFKKMSEKSHAETPGARNAQAAKISSIIKNGKIVTEHFDKNDNCEIMYRIRHKNLKKIVSESDLSSIDVIN